MLERARQYISVILQIFLRDLKRLVHNPIACIILAGVCVLPALYAWYTIEAMWDPYQNTGSIKVAVANDDEGANSEYVGEINVGDEVVAELHNNHDLDWQFVSKDAAIEGVRSSEYYAALIFPTNFSEDFVSVFSGNFTQPKIEYYVNEKLSGSGTKVTDSGASKVETTINESFVAKVSDKVVEIAQKVGADVESKDAEADASLSASVETARRAIADNRAMVGGLIPTIDGSIDSVASSDQALRSLIDSLPELESRLSSTSDTLSDIRDTLNSYSSTLASKVTQSALALSKAAVDANVAASRIAGDVSESKASVDAALAEAQRLNRYNNELLDSLRNSPAATTPQVQQAISDIEQQNADLGSTIETLRTLSAELDEMSQSIENATSTVADVATKSADELRQSASDFQTNILPKIDSSLDSMSSAIGTLRGAIASLKDLFSQETTMLTQLSSMLDRSKAICSDIDASLAAIEENLGSTYTDLKALQNSASYKELTTLLKMNPDDVSSFMSSPVKLDTITIYPVNPYGSGVAPFFSNLALWVCGFILMAIVRIRVDPTGLPKFTPTQGYFGRWMFYISVGLVQSIVICAGDLIIGVQCVNPAAFFGAGILAGFVYVNLLYALAVCMRHIGKALAVVLLVMQIPGSSGMFPIEMMPRFYQVINPLLPFTYSIDAMREAIGGIYGNHYLMDMLALGLGFIPIGFTIGLIGVRYGYNVNMLFDSKLSRTDLFNSEQVPKNDRWFRLRPMLVALMQTKRYRQKIEARAKRFNARYPILVRIGWVALIALPVLMLLTLVLFKGSPNEKLILLSWFIAATLLVGAYQVIILFINADIRYQFSLAKSHTKVASKTDASKEEKSASDAGKTNGKSDEHGEGADDA